MASVCAATSAATLAVAPRLIEWIRNPLLIRGVCLRPAIPSGCRGNKREKRRGAFNAGGTDEGRDREQGVAVIRRRSDVAPTGLIPVYSVDAGVRGVAVLLGVITPALPRTPALLYSGLVLKHYNSH